MMRILSLAVLAVTLMTGRANAQNILGNPIVSSQTSTASSSLVGKASQGYLYGFSVTTAASAGYVLIFDATTTPANGTVTPKFCYSVPATSSTGASWIQYPVPFINGIVIEFSTTGCYTATASTTAFISAQVK